MSGIQWTNETWNPATGCKHVSPGCAMCYAEKMHRRQQAMGTIGYERDFQEGAYPNWAAMDKPLGWKKPRMVFVNSMSDLFHPNLTADAKFMSRVWYIFGRACQHQYQVLTKRPESMRDFLLHGKKPIIVPPNVWLGVSAENRKHGVPRIPLLQECPATIRFLSCEPLLEDLGELDLTGIHWVIVGGESGWNPRPMNMAWAQSISDQCKAAGVPYFFKQTGNVLAKEYGMEGKGGGDDEKRQIFRPDRGELFRREFPRFQTGAN